MKITTEKMNTRFVAETVKSKKFVVEGVVVHEADSQVGQVARVDDGLNWVDRVAESNDQLDWIDEVADKVDIQGVINFL